MCIFRLHCSGLGIIYLLISLNSLGDIFYCFGGLLYNPRRFHSYHFGDLRHLQIIYTADVRSVQVRQSREGTGCRKQWTVWVCIAIFIFSIIKRVSNQVLSLSLSIFMSQLHCCMFTDLVYVLRLCVIAVTVLLSLQIVISHYDYRMICISSLCLEQSIATLYCI